MFKWLFGSTHKPLDLEYELVEFKVEGPTEFYRQGIKLLDSVYNGVVVTLDPKVKVVEQDNHLKILFDFRVEFNPKNITINYRHLHDRLGPIVGELMKKDYDA